MDIELLSSICKQPGAPGFEKKIRDFIINEVKDIADEVSTDNIGNVYILKKGKSSDKVVMSAAHMDEIGFIVTHIDENGFIRFHTLGGFDPKTLTAQRVIVHGKEKDLIGVMGSKPIHVMSQEERGQAPKLESYFIDLGLPKEEVDKYIQIGDSITRERDLIKLGDCVNGKSLDNRVAVYVLLKTLQELKDKEIPYDFYGVFTVQEEVGLRGATVAAHRVNPDFGIALDTTIAFDLPGAQAHEKVTSLGDGAAIKIMDASTICDYRMVDFLKKIAEEKEIKWQPEILKAGGTDTAALQRTGKNGAIAGAISIPTRHIHQVIEMSHCEDIDNCIKLLESAIINIDKNDWSH
ncbi:M42 family metallopeptidase [Aureibacter tunicatorum]|uniref:Endoglucanase n=1 Tax=Aureibacter tunicatorum TaxID=866807 RepID=A0AAE3XMH4_9BACT|nr:M42 family metallopeptidase [Aureibacter tunicatorum]MDR6239167.1 endoglucanase [Aureibacter tunicatorum]BDD04907.1 peptidase M42 [Aureibacter tunicatorum]